MCIAQHFVAGEESLHACEKEILLESDNTNLPWVILRAVHRASRLEGVPARARAVLAALARTVDAKKPYGEIFARRELLSERAMQSERTFYRSLSDLEAAGLIERPAQRRYVSHGLFGRAYLHLTARAAILLGLIEVIVEEDHGDDTDNAPDSQGHQVQSQAAEGFEAPVATMADGAIYKDLSPTSLQKRQPGQLPSDLERLRTLGFHEYLIFRLMREAREHGKRLSDVVEVTWSNLAKAGRPINYLRTLLRSPVDFGYTLRAKAADKARTDTQLAQKRKAEKIVRASMGKTFVDSAGTRQCTIDDGGRTLAIVNLAEGVVRRNVGDWQVGFMLMIEEGSWREVSADELNQLRAAAILQREQALELQRQLEREQGAPNHYVIREETGSFYTKSDLTQVPLTEAHKVHPLLKKNDQPRTLTMTGAQALAGLRALLKIKPGGA